MRKRKPSFKNYILEEQQDKHGNTPKVGDHIRFTLYDGVENVVTQIEISEHGYHTPYLLPYLEFVIFDGVITEDDITLKEVISYTVNSIID